MMKGSILIVLLVAINFQKGSSASTRVNASANSSANISENTSAEANVSAQRSISRNSTLVMAQVLFRHGDRNIIHKFPNDPYRHPKYWPEGFGKLTNLGKRQEFELGKWFRKRYDSLVPNGYSFKLVRVHSTEVERAIMSAEANVAGMFPPNGEQIWNEDLLWQPIPVYTIPKSLDTILIHNIPCPLYKRYSNEYFRSKEVRKLLKKFKKTMANASKLFGAPIRTLNNAKNAWDTLYIEKLRNKTLPSWGTEIYDDLEEIARFFFWSKTATPQMGRFKGGFLVKQILDDFIKKSKSKGRHTFIMFSAHDDTIVNTLNTLGLYDNNLPPYASAVLFELHKIDGKFYIKIFFKGTTTDDDIPPLNIPNCGTKCSLEKFSEIYKDILPTKDYKRECEIK